MKGEMMKVLAPIFAAAVALSLFAVSLAQQDITPPVLVDISFEPTKIDTSEKSQVITVTAHITDDLSGFHDGWAIFENEFTDQRASVQFYGYKVTVPNSWVEETESGIRYMGRFELPRYSAYGKWKLTNVALVDMVGNRISHSFPENDESPSADVWPARFNTFTFQNGDAPQEDHLLFISAVYR